MEPLDPDILFKQIRDLPNLMRTQVRPIDRQIRTVLSPLEFLSIRRIHITGDGDSYHAARATELAFEEIAQMVCEPLSAQRFLDYRAPFLKSWAPHDNLVLAISASGRTERGLQAIERARAYGATTVAITGTPESPFHKTADRTVLVDLPDFGQSPGIRTYNASLIGLILMAIRIGEMRDRYHQTEANALRKELADLGDVMEATITACDGPAREAAEAFKGAPVYMYLGSGPSYATAMFSAAKVVEAASEFAFGQDLEEWAHVENLAYPDDMPTFVIAPPGRSRWRAVKLAETAKERGRRVVAVVRDGDEEIARHADFVFPVVGEVREAFSPLVYHIGPDLFAAYLTVAFGRKVYQMDNPAFAQIN
jgi:glucosamine--fructose-6-phosphate aminotransferase (isomerizing)